MKTTSARALLATTALAAGLAASHVDAQQLATRPVSEAPPAIAGMRTINLPLLLDLPGDLAHVRYTPGSLDRSASIQARFKLLALEFERSGLRENVVVLYVLSRDDWKEANLRSDYGLPEPLGRDALAVPGWADEKSIAAWRERLGGDLPRLEGVPLLMTPAEAGALVAADVLAQLEVSRQLLERTGFAPDRPWIAPLMAHLAARLAWDRFEPARMPQIAALVDRLALGDKSGARHRLDDWRSDLEPPKRWWYDARFMRGADEMVIAASPRKLWKMLHDGVSGEKPITEAMLLSRFPKLHDWRAANFAP
jgi:hypothetical protein